MRSHAFSFAAASGFFALVAFSALAAAQGVDVECKKTETQSECHARLKCKANEEVEDCQKRLLRCTANETLDDCKKRSHGGGNTGANPNNQGGDRDPNHTNNNERRDGDDRDRDRDDRDRDRDDRDRDRDRDDNRRDRDDGGSRRQRGDDGVGHRRGRAKGFQANKTFGLGLELGEPTGLNGKLFLSEAGALDFGVGAIYDHYYYGDGFHVYADYLFHPVSLVSAAAFELPFYIGGGLRYWNFHYCYMGLCDYGGSAIGIRVPLGISFDFNRVPLDIFIQVVPVADFISGNYYDRYHDRAHFGVDLSAGIRYWFK